MSSDGAQGPDKSSELSSETPPPYPLSQRAMRTSLDSERSASTSSPAHANGIGSNGRAPELEDVDSESDAVTQLQRELEKTREEKETLAGQYRNLLAKLTTMRTTLGNKLQQDAVRILYHYVHCQN